MRKSKAIDKNTLELIERWRPLSYQDRIESGLPTTNRDMSLYLGVQETTFMTALATIEGSKGIKAAQLADLTYKEDHNYDPDTWLKKRSKQVDKALMKACDEGNPTALRTYYQLTNRLVEKQEVEHKIDGKFIAGIALAASRELREASEGIPEMSRELSVFPPELCLPPG